jgi:nicotinamidase-related amidase
VDQDAERIKKLLSEHCTEITSVHVTLDSHQRMHIAHSVFWQDGAGRSPDPYTLISVEDVKSGKWRAVNEADQETALAYVQELEKKDRFKLCIWPEHCITGTEGHNVTAPVNEGLNNWIDSTRGTIDWIHKGQNVHTEMYSALKAEVVDASDPDTSLNRALIERLSRCERILVCGQAKSHCVNFTVRDLVEHLDWPKEQLHRIWLLEDAMSSVATFEQAGEQFIADMREAGLTIATTNKAFA